MLAVLTAIDTRELVTQREIAQLAGIALGLVNAYLKQCVRNGLIAVKRSSARRYAYCLTEKGSTEKQRLTAQYLVRSFESFRQVKRECTKLLSYASERNWRRLALVGAGDLAEIVALCAKEVGLEITTIIDASHGGPRCAGLRVVPHLDLNVRVVDALVFTAVAQPERQYDAICSQMENAAYPEERLLLPELLGLQRHSDFHLSREAAE